MLDIDRERFTCAQCGKSYTDLVKHERYCVPTALRLERLPPDERPVEENISPQVDAFRAWQDGLQEDVAADLADMRHQRGFDEADIRFTKAKVTAWLDELAEVAPQLLAPYLQEGVSAAEVRQALAVKLFDGIETEKQELAVASRGVPYLEPRVVYPSGKGGAPIVSFDIGELITRKLQHDAKFRKQCRSKSNGWKRGDKWQVPPSGKIRDMDEAAKMRFHPHIMRPATPDEAHDLRVGILDNADDIEVVKNGIGTAAGRCKTCGNQAAVINLPPEERFTPHNILLPVAARASVYKEHGMTRVRNGVDQNGVLHDEPNHARDMRALDEGRWIMIPDDERGGTEEVCLKVWSIGGSCDCLEDNSLTVHVECPQAHHHCRACDYDSRSPMAGRPFSFLRKPAPQAGTAKSARSAFSLRQWTELKTVLNKLRSGMSDTERKRIFSAEGINKLYAAIDPEYVPHVDPPTHLPQDVLHVFPDGLLRSECAWLLYVLCTLFGLSLTSVDSVVASYPHWPSDVRIPKLHAKLRKGRKGNLPNRQSTLRMTGSQVMHFSLHSVAVLSPLLTPEMKAHPAWASWVKLVELFSLVISHELDVADIERIDDLQLEHSALFDRVPQYAGLKRPKHHSLAHLANDVWLFGPPRGYWTFGFESFNKVIKAGAQRSSFQSDTVSLMRYWSMWSARELVKRRRACD